MCLEWLVVRPLASIKPTTELLLVMPDILTALRGAGAGADTWVLEVKHTVRISHPCLHKHTHTQCFFFSQTHPQLLCCEQRFCQRLQIWGGNCWTNNRLTIRAFTWFFFSASSRHSEIDCVLGKPICSINNTNQSSCHSANSRGKTMLQFPKLQIDKEALEVCLSCPDYLTLWISVPIWLKSK